jgi:hypothetical protein
MSQDNWNPGYSVYLYQEGMDLPKEGTYYVVAGNGNWLHKDTGIVRCFVPVDDVPVLPDLKAEESVECKLPKIPARLVWRVKEFFRRVVDKYHAEAEVTLYFNKGTGEFRVHIPEQWVTHGGVRYNRAGLTHREDMGDFLRVGTIHSHCDFGAFHSGIDHGDEEDFDGLHVTFGHNDRDEFTISASVVVNASRMKVDPMTVLEGVRHICDETFTLLDAADDPTYHEWANGLDDWMTMVNGNMSQSGWGAWGFDNSSIRRGDKVVWAGDLTTVQLKTIMGEGPFEVLGVEDGKIVINTNAGLAKFSDKLFRKE